MKCALILVLVSALALNAQADSICDSNFIEEFNYFLQTILDKLIPAQGDDDGVSFNCNFVKALKRYYPFSVRGYEVIKAPYHTIGLHKAVKVFAVDIIEDVRRVSCLDKTFAKAREVEKRHKRELLGFGCLVEDEEITCLFRNGSHLNSRELLAWLNR